MTNLQPEMNEILQRLDQSERRASLSEERLRRAEQRQKTVAAVLLGVMIVDAFIFTRPVAISQTVGQLQTQITAPQNTLQFVTTTGTTMTISGANLVVNNGAGKTVTTNGLGNIFIGYDELRNDTPNTDVRTGRHNLILGAQNSFSSYGGIVAGSDNTITNTFACVEGGFGNLASGAYSNIGGGYQNVASANSSYIGGGGNNTVSTQYSAVVGAITTWHPASGPQLREERMARPSGSLVPLLAEARILPAD